MPPPRRSDELEPIGDRVNPTTTGGAQYDTQHVTTV